LAIGCTSVGQQDLETAKDKIRTLQTEAAASERKVDELERRIESLERERQDTPAAEAPRRPQPPVTESSASGARPGSGPLTRIEIDESDLDAPTPAGTAQALGTSAAGATVTAEAQALYDRGYTLFHEGRYVDAETAFRQFLQSYGTTDLGDNAQYWIGECRWGRRDFRGALDAFRETVERYPDGNKVPDALLKVGQSLEELSDSAGARLAYEEVLSRYPDSRAALVARDRKAELR